MAVAYPISWAQLQNNYQYKVTKKLLLKKYKWIKDVTILNPNEINDYNLIFIDLLIDPYELAEEIGGEVADYVPDLVKLWGDKYNQPFITTFLKSGKEDGKQEVEDVQDDIDSVDKSPAFPKELKLPRDRNIRIGSFFTTPEYANPKDTPPIDNDQEDLSTDTTS